MSKYLIWLLITLPISFKLQITEDVIIFPQEPFILLIVLLRLSFFGRTIRKQAIPFVFLFASLFFISISTIISLFYVFDLIGLLKTIKYALYVLSIILIINDSPKFYKIENAILKIGFLVISFSLLRYLYLYLSLGGSWSHFVSLSTWDNRYMPTGLSNVVIDFKNWTLSHIPSGNHGIYGSYLVLIFLLVFQKMQSKITFKNIIFSFLILLNLFLLTSRESLLLLLIIGISNISYLVFQKKIKQSYVFYFGLASIILFIILMNIELVIFNKVQYMLDSLNENNSLDQNVMYRLNTWKIIVSYFFYHPYDILLGTGFNPTYFKHIVNTQVQIMNFEGIYVTIPENLYFTMICYGGLPALISCLLFFISVIKVFFKRNKVLAFFFIGLIITNIFGAPLLADILLSTIGIVCFSEFQK